MKKLILLVLSCFPILGCAGLRSSDITREEWLAMTAHTFPKTTVDSVLVNAEKVMRTSDPSDVKIYHQQDKMVATRKYLVYAVFSAVSGNFVFDLTAKQQGADVMAQLLISDNSQSFIPMVTAGQGSVSAAGIVAGTQIPWREPYDLFYSRLDSLLYNKPWVTCEAARENTKDVYTESLCLLADDNIPDGVKLSDRSAQIISERNQEEKDAENMKIYTAR